MSVWDKYNEAYHAAYSKQLSKAEFIDNQLELFVGTLAQIKAEETRLVEEFKEYQIAHRKECGDRVAMIFAAYMEELRKEHDYAHPKVFDMAYAMAYEYGHSSGYEEVENYLVDFLDKLEDAYRLGIAEGRSQA